MYFQAKTIKALLLDHKKIKKEFHHIKENIFNQYQREYIFNNLIPKLIDHLKIEEITLYKYLFTQLEFNLILLAYEDLNAHQEIYLLIAELRTLHNGSLTWIKTFNKLTELVYAHFAVEENLVFTLANNSLNSEADTKLISIYNESRVL
jgi:hemerythrin-like domain-containing protein